MEGKKSPHFLCTMLSFTYLCYSPTPLFMNLFSNIKDPPQLYSLLIRTGENCSFSSRVLPVLDFSHVLELPCSPLKVCSHYIWIPKEHPSFFFYICLNFAVAEWRSKMVKKWVCWNISLIEKLQAYVYICISKWRWKNTL